MSLPPFQRVLEEHGPPVRRFLVAALGPPDGDDAFQETFLSALRAYPRLDARADVRAWIFTIAHRKLIDHHRARTRRAVPVADLPERAAPASDGHDPALWNAVRALPPKQRAAVLWRYVVDLPYRDVGRMIGCSEDAARQNVRAGLATLRERWTP
ncbi:MAG TPA: sigma-70 family RNA polymerase sigma factor [Actinomycetota bacterium]|nr:sigma-70 family RNA polymerase sigma factor [Actinomycetota bacterium]